MTGTVGDGGMGRWRSRICCGILTLATRRRSRWISRGWRLWRVILQGLDHAPRSIWESFLLPYRRLGDPAYLQQEEPGAKSRLRHRVRVFEDHVVAGGDAGSMTRPLDTDIARQYVLRRDTWRAWLLRVGNREKMFTWQASMLTYGGSSVCVAFLWWPLVYLWYQAVWLMGQTPIQRDDYRLEAGQCVDCRYEIELSPQAFLSSQKIIELLRRSSRCPECGVPWPLVPPACAAGV